MSETGSEMPPCITSSMELDGACPPDAVMADSYNVSGNQIER